VIDYTRDELTDTNERYDLVLDAAGKRKSSALKTQCQQAVKPDGTYVSVDDGRPRLVLDDLIMLNELVEARKLRPIIDSQYPLEQIVEAHSYVDKGHKKGNVVITITHDDAT
jgi:NADPH:quinone reductase-like Zn-dependent oxidoreductase